MNQIQNLIIIINEMKEIWDKLKPYDQERLIKNDIIKKDDIKYNLDILIV